MGSEEKTRIADLESGLLDRVAGGSGDYYVGLAESPEAAATNRERRALRIASTVFITICCFLAALYGAVSLYPRIEALVTKGAVPGTFSFNSPLSSVNLRGEEALQQQPHRTSYHYQPAKNWMNAPMYYKGYYHLFYQYNPDAAVWGHIAWGHAVSTDLIHWLYLENALEPDQWYDDMGVWSGSATIGPDGVPFILYTGGSNETGHCNEQTQNMAVPADPEDPLLRKWVKVKQNPIVKHPEDVGEQDMRDPTTAWQLKDGSWVFTVGAVVGSSGRALQYKSKDLIKWELQDTLLHTLPESGMWECVDFFPVDYDTPSTVSSGTQKYVFKTSMVADKHDYYTIGTYDEVAQKFIPDDPKRDVGSGFRYDYGKYYASKSLYDPVKNRHVVWAWVNESDTEAMDIAKGWSSVLGIPRTVTLDSKTDVSLIQWPIEEVNALRGAKLSMTDLQLDAGAVVEVESSAGGQLDVEVVFEYPNISAVGVVEEANFNDNFDCSQGGSAHRGVLGPFGLLVLTDNDFQEQTALFFYLAHTNDGQWTTRFCSDQSRSSLLKDIDTTVYGSHVKVLPTEDFLSVRVLVDRSIVESFVQGGRMAITSRVYPRVAVDNLANLYLFNNGTTPVTVRSVDVYQMTHVVMHPI
ncbi:unnamed protein product [Sphagnum jensenii]|uniref:Uncharacterized protein n=1 Tax=Sphagnum jensenii TaxID=128206 RepID=A0ABP1BW06_9BRYO